MGGLAGVGGAKGTGSAGLTKGKAGGSGTAGHGFGGAATNGGGSANGTPTDGTEVFSSYYYGGGGGAGGNGGTGVTGSTGGTGGARGTSGAYWNNAYPDGDPRYPGPGGNGPGGGGGGGDSTYYQNYATNGAAGSTSGGSGGGYLRVTATNITVSGSILADAGNGGNGGAGGQAYPSYSSSGGGGGGGHGGGGGSGGGIYLRASGTLTVVAGYSLSAKGGNGGAGGAGGDGYTSGSNYDGYIGSGGNGGSGGKIAAYYGTLVGTLSPVVTGGTGGALAAYPPGQLGTAVVGTAGSAGASTTQALSMSFPQEYNLTSDEGKTLAAGSFDTWSRTTPQLTYDTSTTTFVDTFDDLNYTSNPAWTPQGSSSWTAATGALESQTLADTISTPVSLSLSSNDYEWSLRWRHESATSGSDDQMLAYLFSSSADPSTSGSGYYFVSDSNATWYNGKGYAGLGWYNGGSSGWIVKTWDISPQLFSAGTGWHTAKITHSRSGVWSLSVDGVLVGSKAETSYTTASYVAVRGVAATTAHNFFLDSYSITTLGATQSGHTSQSSDEYVAGGLTGFYYDAQGAIDYPNFDRVETSFTDYKFSRTDGPINFSWGTGTPDSRLQSDTFTVRWVGKVYADYNDVYTFYVNSDDGSRLWVDGRMLIGMWQDQTVTETSGTTAGALSIGQHDILLEYYDNRDQATVQLSWSSASVTKAIIPSGKLYYQTNAGTWGTNSLTYYSNNMDASTYMPPVSLPAGIQPPSLTFWHWYNTFDSSDYGQVEKSVNGGAWTKVLPGAGTYTGNGASWSRVTYSLSSDVGNTVQFRFRFVSDGSSNALAGQTTGWFVDDVKISYPVVIMEYMPTPSAGTDEWVKLYNYGTDTINLNGWNVADQDSSSSQFTYTFASFTLGAGKTVTIHTDSGTNNSEHVFANFSGDRIDGTGDSLTLKDGGGRSVDFVRFPYGNAADTIPSGLLWNGNVPTAPTAGNSIGIDYLGTDTGDGGDWQNFVYWTITLKNGANFVSLPNSSSPSMMASSLGRTVTSSTSAMAFEVMKWNTSTAGWDSIVSTDGLTWIGTDFSLDKGAGYIVKVTNAPVGGVTLNLTGRAIASAVGLSMANGLRMVAVPYSSTSYTAFTFGDAITSQGGGSTRCYTVMKFNADTQSYDVATWSLTFGWTGIDFSIAKGESYFVKVSGGPSSWTFTP